MREMICICCPLGCHLTVDDSDLNNIKVTGNTCKRGENYGRDEIICPKRMVTSSVKVLGGEIEMVSVKTSDSIEKSLIFEALETLKGVQLKAPVKIGQIVVKNVCNTNVDFVATKNVR